MQRFGDKGNLHRLVMERLTDEVRTYFAGDAAAARGEHRLRDLPGRPLA